MRKRFLMGLDIGGGSGRCLLASVDGAERVVAAEPWSFPRRGPLAHELDLDAVWRKLCRASTTARARAGIEPQQVIGVSVSSLRFGLVLVDADGRPLFGATNRDAQAAGEALRMAAAHGQALNAATGHWPSPIMMAPRLQWLGANRPELRDRAAWALSPNEAMTLRMCGQVATDASQAGETLLFDLATRSWSTEWLDRLELSRALLPEPVAPGAALGVLSPDAARDLGAAAGIPVAQGGGDTQAGALALGAVDAGHVAILAGTTAPVVQVGSHPGADPDARCWLGHHLLPDRWLLESSAGNAGEALAGFAALLFPDSPQPTAALLAEAGDAELGAGGMLSTFGAFVMDARSATLPVGNLTLSPLLAQGGVISRADLTRSLVEGIGYAMRANLEQLGAVGGHPAEDVALGGGLSQSPWFGQLLADVCGVPSRTLATPESSALGAAACAGVAAGVFADLRAGADRLRGEVRVFEPDPGRAARYAELFEGWQRLRAAAGPGDEVASALATPWLFAASAGGAASRGSQRRLRTLVTASVDESSLAKLRELGPVEYASFRDRGRMLKGDSLVEALQGFDVFITEIDLVDAESLKALPELRVVASCRGNAVNVDVEACSLLGVPVLNAPGRNADAVADLTLAFLLMLSRRFPAASSLLADTEHEPGEMRVLGLAFAGLQGRELWRKTVGLVGLGAVGRGVARRLVGFGARVLAFDPFVTPEQAARDAALWCPLDDLLAQSDFVSLHAPVTPETEGLIGRRELARMRPDAFLINTARPALLDEQALIEALDAGRLAGAALDVFDAEPPGSTHSLLRRENVLCTPHVGGNTAEIAAHQGRIIAEDLTRLVETGTPRFSLDPETARALDLSAPRPAPDERALARLAELAAGPGPSTSDLNRSAKR